MPQSSVLLLMKMGFIQPLFQKQVFILDIAVGSSSKGKPRKGTDHLLPSLAYLRNVSAHLGLTVIKIESNILRASLFPSSHSLFLLFLSSTSNLICHVLFRQKILLLELHLGSIVFPFIVEFIHGGQPLPNYFIIPSARLRQIKSCFEFS